MVSCVCFSVPRVLFDFPFSSSDEVSIQAPSPSSSSSMLLQYESSNILSSEKYPAVLSIAVFVTEEGDEGAPSDSLRLLDSVSTTCNFVCVDEWWRDSVSSASEEDSKSASMESAKATSEKVGVLWASLLLLRPESAFDVLFFDFACFFCVTKDAVLFSLQADIVSFFKVAAEVDDEDLFVEALSEKFLSTTLVIFCEACFFVVDDPLITGFVLLDLQVLVHAVRAVSSRWILDCLSARVLLHHSKSGDTATCVR